MRTKAKDVMYREAHASTATRFSQEKQQIYIVQALGYQPSLNHVCFAARYGKKLALSLLSSVHAVLGDCRVEMVCCCPAAPAFSFHVAVLDAALHVHELLSRLCCQLSELKVLQMLLSGVEVLPRLLSMLSSRLLPAALEDGAGHMYVLLGVEKLSSSCKCCPGVEKCCRCCPCGARWRGGAAGGVEVLQEAWKHVAGVLLLSSPWGELLEVQSAAGAVWRGGAVQQLLNAVQKLQVAAGAAVKLVCYSCC